MITASDIVSSLIATGLYLLLFLAAELWRRLGSPDPEHTRKVVHVGGGLVALSFPWLFVSHWPILVLALLFVAALIVTRRTGILQSVQGVQRITVGEILYPIAIYLALLITRLYGTVEQYIYTVLVLAISDTAAALIGRRFGSTPFYIAGEKKTLAGSTAFAVSMLMIAVGLEIVMPGGIFPDIHSPEFFATAIILLVAPTLAEALTPRGFDNLSVPLVVLGALLLTHRMEPGTLNAIAGAVAIAGAAGVYLAFRKDITGTAGAIEGTSVIQTVPIDHLRKDIMETIDAREEVIYQVRKFATDSPLMEDFRNVAGALYAGDPFWRPPADPTADALCYVIYRDDVAVGRACGLVNPEIRWNDQDTGLIGWYECADDPIAAEMLLNTAAEDAAAEGRPYVIGPINGSTWHRYRAAEPSEAPPFFLDVHNKPWYAAQFQAAEFETIARYSSTEFDLHAGRYERVEKFEEFYRGRGIDIRPFRRDAFDSEMRLLYEVTLASFANNMLYTPIPFESFRDIYAPVESLIDPELVMIAEDQQKRPLGFIFTIADMFRPDRRSLIIKTVGAVPVPEARGLGTFLVEKMHVVGLRKGFDFAIHALMHESNSSANMLADESRPLRTYRLFGRAT